MYIYIYIHTYISNSYVYTPEDSVLQGGSLSEGHAPALGAALAHPWPWLIIISGVRLEAALAAHGELRMSAWGFHGL